MYFEPILSKTGAHVQQQVILIQPNQLSVFALSHSSSNSSQMRNINISNKVCVRLCTLTFFMLKQQEL